MSYHALCVFISVLLLQILSIAAAPTMTEDPDPKYQWDILIFTQRWPMTACSQWEEENKNNTCAFPDPKDLWTIHGIWPTKSGTRGPENCNKTWHFNETVIDPIKSQLENFWTNVEKNTQLNSLWKHEWTKHGTCAAVLPQLNNELKYFQQGLEWIQQYNMKNILSQQGVVPNDKGYTVQQIFDSVQTTLGKTGIIQCVVDRRTKLSLISEIRICFNKTLDLTNCDSVKELNFARIGNVLTNCNVKKPVMYPNKINPAPTIKETTVPTTASAAVTTTVPKTTIPIPHTTTDVPALESLYRSREHLITFYRTVKLLIWATL